MAHHPVVVMGVSGSGKSKVGAALAGRLGVRFQEGDNLHPRSNIEKMSLGKPLDDDSRWPWLDRVGTWLADHDDGGVVACSALRRSYRDRLRGHCPSVEFVLLHGHPDVIRRRLESRQAHFMPPSLLDSQFEILELLAADERGVVLEAGLPVDDLVAAYLVREPG